ncbi:MAG TPA: hypothetical protein VGC38_06695 [Pseudolabrys sp.]
MPARRKSEKQSPNAFHGYQEELAAGRRSLCTSLMFWRTCGQKKCLRAHACVVNEAACFDRLWPIVPERLKVGIRAASKAKQARLSTAETKAEIMRELRRWDEMIAQQNAPQTAAKATAEPAPQLPPVVRVAPRVPSPRMRVL